MNEVTVVVNQEVTSHEVAKIRGRVSAADTASSAFRVGVASRKTEEAVSAAETRGGGEQHTSPRGGGAAVRTPAVSRVQGFNRRTAESARRSLSRRFVFLSCERSVGWSLTETLCLCFGGSLLRFR